MSRADFYVLDAVAGLQKATAYSQELLGGYKLKFGGKDCSTVPHEDSKTNFPNALGNIDDPLSYFAREFGFAWKTYIRQSSYGNQWI